MSESTVRTILRLIAVITMLVGTIMLMMTVVALVQFGGRAELGMASLLLTQSVVAAEGLLLYVLSEPLARKIVQ
jgi:hypothetical protein